MVVALRHRLEFGHSRFRVGQIVNLRPIGNRPVALDALLDGPITNRPQVANLPHITQTTNVQSLEGVALTTMPLRIPLAHRKTWHSRDSYVNRQGPPNRFV